MSIVRKVSQWNRRRLTRRRQCRLALNNPYAEWWARHGVLDPVLLEQLRLRDQSAVDGPLISVVMPVYSPDLRHLQCAVQSVLDQTWFRLELCIADDASPEPSVRNFLSELARRDARVKLFCRPVNGHISQASNSALALASGEFIALMDQDDLLVPWALSAMVEAVRRHPQAQMFYSDEDKLDDNGNLYEPHFKPDYNAWLMRAQNYLCHFTMIGRQIVDSVGGFRPGFEGAQDHDLFLRCGEQVPESAIVHVPLVLYHWRSHPGSTASSAEAKPYALRNGVRAVQEHLQRVGIAAQVTDSGQTYRVVYAPPVSWPLVSVIIPTRDRPALLEQCVRSVLERTTYPNVEFLLVDNGTADNLALKSLKSLEADARCRVIRVDEPFNFSRLNNTAAKLARGHYLCLMNNDVEITQPDWLQRLVTLGEQRDIGVVGPRLLYPDGSIQHAGLVLGIDGVAAHAFRHQRPGERHYMGRHALTHELSAVTAAVLLTPRSVFEAVGGLDEVGLPVNFNDVDYCLKVRSRGMKVLYAPEITLMHHESISRGRERSLDEKSRLHAEIECMKRRWCSWLRHDPAYNPNLSLETTNFCLASEPRVSVKEWLGLGLRPEVARSA